MTLAELKARITLGEVRDWAEYNIGHPLDHVGRLESMIAKVMWLCVNLWRKSHIKKPRDLPLDTFIPRYRPKTQDDVKGDILRAFQSLPNEIIDKRKAH